MAFRIAISGLRAATADLDVTGNNIANTNTTGFKSSRAQFADVYAASSLGTSRDAIGQGVQLSAVAQQFNQGNVAFTDNNLDLAISGEGLFVLQDPSGSQVYSRAGAFGVDENGFVVNAFGQRLTTFQANGGSITGALGPLQLSTANISPQPTSLLSVGVNLDAGATPPTVPFNPVDPSTYNNSTSTTVFDSLGTQHLATIYFRNTAPNTWETHLRVDNDDTQTLAPQVLTFDSAGQLISGMPVNYGGYVPTTGASPINMDFDFGASTQFGAGFGVNSLTQDGFSTGRLSGIDIDDQGVVLARFTNGQSQSLGQVVLANFSNSQGLQPISDTNWAETNSSGAPLMGAPGTASLGLIQSGALEESNVDLAEQLVNMIVAQRNFQANAQMIRAEDELTQTIINIR
jgi:flagellar hook protein FlgE